MNRKKITLLLTGLLVASGLMMGGCSSSNNGSTNNNSTGSNASSGDSGFKRSTDRTITQYTGDLFDNTSKDNKKNSGVSDPNIAYAGDIAGTERSSNNNIGTNDTRVDNRVNSTNDTINMDQNSSYNNGESNTDGMSGYGYGTEDSYMTDQNNEGSGYIAGLLDDTKSYNSTNFYQNSENMNDTANAFDGGVAYDDSYIGDTTNSGSFSDNTTTDRVNGSLYNRTDTAGEISNGISNDIMMNNSSNIGNSTSNSDAGMDESGLKNNDSLNSEVDTRYMDDSSYEGVQTRQSSTQVVGEFTPLKAVGGSEIVGAGGDGKVQGTIGVTFKLSQEAIDAAGLDVAIQEAYTEMINDSNNSFQGDGTTTKREALQDKLKTAFANNSGATIILKDPNGTIVNIPFNAEDLFPAKSTNPDYVRYIIDLGQMKNGGLRSVRSAKSNSTDVALRMIIRNKTVDNTGNDELNTNTLYTFVGLGGTAQGDNVKIASDKFVSGFTIPTTTTGKQSSSIIVKSEGTTNALQTSANFETTVGSDITGTNKLLYTTNIKSSEFIDTFKYDITKPTNVVAGGNYIKFPNIIFNDPDDSIVKIEIEDNKGNKYPCSLIATETEDQYCLQVNDLKTEMRYIFTKINVTSNINGIEESDSILIATSDSGAAGNASDPKVKINSTSIQTVKFSEPRLELGAKTPDGDVLLPDGLKVKAVKNDSTALRYIFKVDNSQGNIGDLRVTGLRDNQKAIVEKMVDKKSKLNYCIVTLTGLEKDTDYGYITLELDYTDLEGNTRNTRQSLSNINTQTVNKPKFDNRTEKEALTGTEAINIVLNTENTSKYARSAKIPVFIDDMNRLFTGMNFTSKDNPNVKVEYREGYLYITGLEPEKTTDINLDFIYNDLNNKEQKLTKYIKVTTATTPKVDVIADTSTVKGNDVSIKFDYSKMPTIPIKSVTIKDENDKVLESTWDSETSTITLKGLKANTKYSDLIATFTLQNSLTVDYPITPFTTKEEIVKPTGKVADFVKRVYVIALGREPEVEGWNFWINKLEKKEITATEFIAENLMTQPEFVDRELTKSRFVTTMYSLIVNREPDQDGQAYWERKYDEYQSQVQNIAELRIKIAREMMDQQEFKDLVTSLNLKY